MFVVLEGVDGCGKSTHARLLAGWLRKSGHKVLLTAEPTRGRIGKFIREILSGKVRVDPKTLALLFTADRAEHMKEIKAALDAGKIVISERYYHSTVAYQSAQGVDRTWLLKLNEFAIKPDLVLFLDVDPGVGAGRTSTGEIFEEGRFLSKVRGGYLKFKGMVKVDSGRERKIVQDEIRSIVSKRL
ncbi:MAG: dTMP kinase [Candidatus Altiarchaeota archaeon]